VSDQKTYTPDKWVVVKIKGKNVPLTYKVFACWYGGYLNGDSWKINSGIKKVTKKKNYWFFEGFSGSVYECYKGRYGTNMYGGGVLKDIIKRSREVDVTVDIMDENTNWRKLKYD
jgi:hypothetical protein